MKGKLEIVSDWLPRYTGMPLEDFGKYILLTNFTNYLELFSEENNVEIMHPEVPMPAVTAVQMLYILSSHF